MTSTDMTEQSQNAQRRQLFVEGEVNSISLEYDLNHPPEKVWRALTDPELLAEWLMPVIGLKLQPGAPFTFKREPIGGWDGSVNCRILEFEAHKKLSYAWSVLDEIDTVVIFTLTPTASGTHLSLLHSGFKPHQKGAFGGQRYGWKMMVGKKLIELLATIHE
jgi:uncharacterized protein YndB with AHSA1/START domain